MENQLSSKSFTVNNGVILGVAMVLISLVIYATGNHLEPHWSSSVLSGVLFVGIIVFGIKKYKEANGSLLSWGKGVKIGVGIAVLAGLINVIYSYIFTSFIEPDFMSQMMEIQNQSFLDQGMTEKQIEVTKEMSKKFQSPGIVAAMGIIMYAIGGFVVSAIGAAIMKKSEEEQY
tara:strand:+ start:143 stop:664 length:522 start_codon:yes stop_codon:yes gene_type:complete